MKLYPSPVVDNQKGFNIVLKAVRDRISPSEYRDLYYKAKKADEDIYVYQKKVLLSDIEDAKWYNRLLKYIYNLFRY